MSDNPFAAPRAQAPVPGIEIDFRSSELGFGDLLSFGIIVFQRNFPQLLIIWALHYIPLHIANKVIEGTRPLNALVYLIPVMFFSSYMQCVVVAFVGDAVTSKAPSLGRAYSRALGKFPSVFGASFIVGLIVGLWSLLLIIPGIIAMVRFMFFPHAIVLDDARAGDAPADSKRLAQGHFWPMLGLFMFSMLFATLSGGIVGALASMSVMPDVVAIAIRSIFSLGTHLAGIMVVIRYLNYTARTAAMFDQGIGSPTNQRSSIEAESS